MYILTSIATDNILASYASRFERDPNGDGYRFIAGDYGDGVFLGAVLTALPLIPTFRQGYRLYHQPAVELYQGRAIAGHRHSTREIISRRISGMSDLMIGLMVIIPLIGLIISWLEIIGGQRSVAALGGFGAMFVVGCVLVVWKHKRK